MPEKIIFLWSTRRTLSMAFHRAIYQLDGIKHFCEPFALPHYFGPEKRSVQFSNNSEVAERFGKIPTYDERVQDITADYKGYHTTFVKEHAMYVWPDILPKEIMQTSFHTFIIRNPAKAIKSFYRQTLVDFEESLWNHIVPEELGFKEQVLMYNYVTIELKKNATIIDADDLMMNPREVLEKYCAVVGLQFDENMLNWSKDQTKTEEKPWDFLPNSWIKDVKETKGFRKTDMVQDEGVDYPQFIHDAISQNMQYYNTLLEHKLQIINPSSMLLY
jgi:hypothetical protein